MAKSDVLIANLRCEIGLCEEQLQSLKAQLAEAESRTSLSSRSEEKSIIPSDRHNSHLGGNGSLSFAQSHSRWPLSSEEYERYGRQLIMPEIGLKGQLRLKNASVLIVGVGGLGCPAAAYLAGAGVGTIGLSDGDTVEKSNLHRQILHCTSRVGISKVDSAVRYLKDLNPNIKYVAHKTHLSASNALDIFAGYDVVLDCTDTPASRYLISDGCVLLGKPLVSASALRTDGQLMVLNYPPRPAGDPEGGPCYRCMYPKPPPPESVMTCGEGGILGPVVGVMGILQALETIKLIASGVMEIKMGGDCQPGVISCAQPVPSPQWLLFSGYSSNPVRSFRMRRRQKSCAACSAQATVTRDLLVSGSMDYLQFCGVLSPINALSEDERVSSNEFAAIRSSRDAGLSGHKASCTSVLIDTRDPTQFDLCHLHGSINISFAEIAATVPEKKDISEAQVEPNGNNGAAGWLQKIRELPFDVPIYVVCRLGNDSQLAVQKFKELGLDVGGRRQIRDISGGLKAWRDQVDPDFPKY